MEGRLTQPLQHRKYHRQQMIALLFIAHRHTHEYCSLVMIQRLTDGSVTLGLCLPLDEDLDDSRDMEHLQSSQGRE